MSPLTPAPPSLRAALASDEWFSTCAPALQTELLRLARMRHLNPDESLFARGGEADGLCCVVAGALRIGALDAQGDSTLLAYLEPYQWFGEISLIDGRPRTHDAVADGPTQVLVVPREPLLAWLGEHPAMWRELARLACRKLRVLFVAVEELAQMLGVSRQSINKTLKALEAGGRLRLHYGEIELLHTHPSV